MGRFDDEFADAIENVPRRALELLIDEKLRKQGIEVDGLASQVAEALFIREASDDHISIDCKEDVGDIDLGITAEEADRLIRSVTEFNDKLPDIIVRVADQIADNASRRMLAEYERRGSEFKQDRDALAQRIDADWGNAFVALRALIEYCREVGDAFNLRNIKSRGRRIGARDDLLGRLHIRACRIADEIVHLLDAGFSEGAMARWRTLYEVSVVMTLIAEGGDALARRYTDHEAVEQKRIMDDHVRAATAAGVRTPPVADQKAVNREYARVFKKYGKDFAGGYGWASNQLGVPKDPRFVNLQEYARTLEMKLDYRLASYGSHSSMRSLAQPVHRWDPTLNIPGTFEPGFEDPGANTASALTLATSLLGVEPWDMDRVIEVEVLLRLRDEATSRMSRTSRSLARRANNSLRRAWTRAAGRRGSKLG